jgi:hypothetical protein
MLVASGSESCWARQPSLARSFSAIAADIGRRETAFGVSRRSSSMTIPV